MRMTAHSERLYRARIALAAVLLTLSLGYGCGPGNTYQAPPPPEVTVSLPIRKSVSTYLEYKGETRAVEKVDVRARVKGFLVEQKFEPGAIVQANELLFVIEEKPFQAKVQEAEAKLADANATLKKAESSRAREVAQAQLALDQASLLLAKIEDSRQRSLASRNAASQQDIDRADANSKKSFAQVQSDEASLEQARADYDVNILSAKATVADAEAQLENARIDLGYCRVTSPVLGRISRNLVDLGNLVGDGQATLLATVLKEDPIYAYMSVSESDLLRFRKMVAEGKRPDFRTDVVPLELGMSDEAGFPHLGKVDYADPGVDPATGTIQARGIFPNADRRIVPGTFVRVRVPFEVKGDALLVPEVALGSDQTGRFVLVVNEKNVVDQRKVEIGSQVDDLRIIESGLKPDDRVVVNGLQRARPGQIVKPKMAEPAVPPSASAEAKTPAPAPASKQASSPKS